MQQPDPTPTPRRARRPSKTVGRALGVSFAVHAGLLVALGAVVAPYVGGGRPLESAARLETPVTLEEVPEPLPPPPLVPPARPLFEEPPPPPETMPAKDDAPFERNPTPTAPPALTVHDPFGGRVRVRMIGRRTSSPPAAPAVAGTGPEGLSAAVAPTPIPAPLVRPVALASNAAPAYPRMARRRGWTGTVLLELDIAETGRVLAARVLESSGRATLDVAARLAVLDWRYEPARRGARPVAFTLRQPVTFSLE